MCVEVDRTWSFNYHRRETFQPEAASWWHAGRALKTLCSIRVVLLSILNEHQRVSQGPHISESVAKEASWSIQYPPPKRTEDFFYIVTL